MCSINEKTGSGLFGSTRIRHPHAGTAQREIKHGTYVVRIFSNRESCLRLIRALATEMHENWIEATRYLNMSFLKEQKKEALRQAAA